MPDFSQTLFQGQQETLDVRLARTTSPRGEKVCCFTVLEIRNAASHPRLPSEAPLHQSVGWLTPFIAVHLSARGSIIS